MTRVAYVKQSPKQYLVWKDGRREETDSPVCLTVLKTVKGDDGRFRTYRFASARRIEPDGTILYNEESWEDDTAKMREAGQRMRNETFASLGLRIPDPGVFAKGRFVGETDAEMRRRVNLMHGREPEDDG